ncbi:Cytochrome P450-like protein 92 [Elsinoe fawcettii]|nr:Cytochrome P450-like protein 92 [Elsinoe fawcettii]
MTDVAAVAQRDAAAQASNIQSLHGKVAVISGSSSGIGKAIAVELASRGASTVINYPSQELKSEADTVMDGLAVPGIAVCADISTVDGPQILVNAAVEAYGKIDILVNNAALAVNKPFEEQTMADWDLLVNLNGRGTFLLTQHTLPHMSRPGGRIINICSASSRGPPPWQTIYAGTKGMVDSFTKVWAKELAKKYGCTVNAVSPGPTRTEGFANAGEEVMKFLQPTIDATPAAMRMGETTEIAYAVAMLSEDRARWINGYLYRVWTSPLRPLPGPWYSHLTHLWLKKHVITGRRLHYIHSLHEKYGPIVRVSPTEVDVSSPELHKQVHRVGSGFLKDPWYQSFRSGDTHDVFSMIDVKEHAERRRLFAPLWTNSALHEHWEDMVIDKVRLAVSKIRRDALVGEACVFQWWTFMTTDVISQLAFGESTKMLQQEARNEYIRDVEEATKIGGFLAEFQWLRPLLRVLPIPTIQHALAAEEKTQSYGMAAIRAARSGNLSKQNVFSRIIAKSNSDEEGALTEYQIAFEAAGFIVAGSGTTAVTLTYLVWAVLQNRDVQARLEEEVCNLQGSFRDAELESLPILNAVIDETLRLYGAAPGNLPRTCPEGGVTLSGHYIPQGTTVSSQAYTLHRNEDVYPEPEKFNPWRFINRDGKYEPSKTAWAPFGAGVRGCLGVHLAKMELRHGTAEFFRQCRGAHVANSMRPSDMEMRNFFLISPRGDRCVVTLL